MPFDDPYWTLTEAMSWAMWRDRASVSKDPDILLLSHFDPPLMSHDDAKQALLHGLQRGDIKAVANGEPVGSERFAGTFISHHASGYVVGIPALDGIRLKPGAQQTAYAYYDRLRLWSDDVRLHLPELGTVTAPVLSIVPKEPETAGKAATEPPAAADVPSVAGKKGPGRPKGSRNWDTHDFDTEYLKRLRLHGMPAKGKLAGWDSRAAAAATVLDATFGEEELSRVEAPVKGTIEAWGNRVIQEWIQAGRPRQKQETTQNSNN